MKLKDKVAIVTGGGRGIGKAIALAFAKEGAKLIVVSRTPHELKETAIEIHNLKGESFPIVADISKEKDVKRMIRLTVEKFGTVDILVNNAGIQGPIGPMVENDVNQWIQTIKINLIGTFLCSKVVLPIMIKQKRGKIINLSGGGATSPRPYFTAYASSKAAVARLTETMAEEVKEFNIQVNAIAPGATKTKMTSQILEAGDTAGLKAFAEAEHVMETGGTPYESPASLAVFLASSESDGLTGRLISAIHDDWQNFHDYIPEIMASDFYTLRRISEFELSKIPFGKQGFPEWKKRETYR